MTTVSAPTEASPRISAPLGQVFAWATLAAINAVFIVTTVSLPSGGGAVRALHHFYDAGQLLALGFLLSGLFEAWQRWGPKRAFFSLLALFALAFTAGFFVFAADLDGAAGALFEPLWLSRSILIACAAATLPFALAIGFLVAKKWFLVPLGVLLALALAIENQFLLPNDYPGIHFYLAWVSATLLGMSVSRLPAPWASVRSAFGRAAMTALRAVLIVCAATSVVVWPGSTVALEIFKVQGAVVVPLLARLRALEEGSGAIPLGQEEWFEDRSSAPEQPPTGPSILAENPIVIVLVVDCMRADLIEGDAHAKVLPNMLALRDAGVHFTAARSSAPATTQSIASLFLGKYYSGIYWELATIGKDPRVYPKADTSPRFPDLLRDASIPTVIVTGLSGLVNAYGIVSGFSEEVVVSSRANAPEVMKKAIARIEKAKNEPLFLYIHVADAHSPYDRAGKQGTPFDRYVREIGLVDQALGDLTAAIEKQNIGDRVAIVLTADHGEAFGEHGDTTHAHTVYDELLRVPLIIKAPGAAPRRVDDLVSTVDIGPTVLDLFERPTPGPMLTQSLVPFLRGEDPNLTRPVVAESARRMQVMVFDDGIKVIRDVYRGTVEIYDLKRDPKELSNLYQEGDDSDPHLDLLRAFFSAQTLRREGYTVPYQKW